MADWVWCAGNSSTNTVRNYHLSDGFMEHGHLSAQNLPVFPNMEMDMAGKGY